MLPSSLFPVWALLSLVSGHTIQGRISLPTYNALESFGTSLKLTDLSTGIQRSTFLSQNGSFSFENIQEGLYLLDADTVAYVLDTPLVRIEVRPEEVISEDGTQNEVVMIRAYEYLIGLSVDELVNRIDYPLVLSPPEQAPQKVYYEDKDKGLAATGQLGMILSNPWLLLGIVFAVGMLALPKLIEKLDPEVAQRMKEQKVGAKPTRSKN